MENNVETPAKLGGGKSSNTATEKNEPGRRRTQRSREDLWKDVNKGNATKLREKLNKEDEETQDEELNHEL